MAVACFAAVSAKEAFSQVNVPGYYRSNGTYVQPHQRTRPDSIRKTTTVTPVTTTPTQVVQPGVAHEISQVVVAFWD